MRVSEFWVPNHELDPTAVSVSDLLRFGFTEFLSFFVRAVPSVGQLDRSVSLTRPADFQRRTTENRTCRSESDRFWMPTFGVTDWSARSVSEVVESWIRTGRTGASGCRISSPPMIITGLISERTR